MTKTPYTLLYLLLTLIIACDKPDDIPQPNQNKSDTLAVGWSQQKIANGTLDDVFFQDALVGYTAGNSFYKTNDGGTTWIKVTDTFNTINLFVAPGGMLHAIKNSGTVYKKFFNWAQNGTHTLLNQNGRADDLYFTNSNIGFIALQNGLLKTTDGGNKWDRVTTAPAFQGDSFSGLYFLDSTVGWVFTGNKIFRSNGTITNWSASNLPATITLATSSLYAVSPNIIYAVGYHSKVLKSTDGGRNFLEVATLTTPGPGYADIHFVDELNGYVCKGNRIYQTKDGGNNWTSIVGLAESQITELHFVDANHGWACTSDGRILKYAR